eukprot:COSAG06_NODE_61799_length_266_cov_1.688623_1_plen_72_part_10
MLCRTAGTLDPLPPHTTRGARVYSATGSCRHARDQRHFQFRPPPRDQAEEAHDEGKKGRGARGRASHVVLVA